MLVDAWRLMCWRDMRANVLHWRAELAERHAAAVKTTQGAHGDEDGATEGAPKLGLGIAPRWMIDRLPVDQIGEG